jgi:hypothetical protein
MYQLYYLTRNVTEESEDGVLYLNNETWFPNTMPHVREFKEMLKEEEEYEELLYKNEADNIDEIRDDKDEPEEEETEFLAEMVLKFWKKLYKALESDFATCGWYLCIVPEVMDDVQGNDTIEHRDMTERVITQLCQDSTDG